MSDFEFDATDFFEKLDKADRNVTGVGRAIMEDSVMDLAKIASNIAPIEYGALGGSAKSKTAVKRGDIEGEVTFSAVNKDGNGRFDYAYWTHEMDYNLGPASSRATGMAGYSVGNKYLERPLKGEAKKYVDWWAKALAKGL
ncbi:hypothetical protein RGU11_06740 [Rossellomorea marisflavi]|uniref:hypothetical protein n=1 Tax=Rossellomorea marisflavi TaxID=189381 RepID=UPI002852FA4B|nr:hypothetical protein [Rossellomorea marisflavi]MDR4936063.1 hypothetical protein [Rossellomorea marisflavi]